MHTNGSSNDISPSTIDSNLLCTSKITAMQNPPWCVGRTRCIRIHTEDRVVREGESIRKYPRKLESLRRAESVADRGTEEKTELGLIYDYKFSSGRGSGNTIQAQFSPSLRPFSLSSSPSLTVRVYLPLGSRRDHLLHWSLPLGDLEEPWTRELRRMNTFVRHPSRARMKHGTDVTEVRWKCDDRMEVVVYRVKSSADLCFVSNSMRGAGGEKDVLGTVFQHFDSLSGWEGGAISRENAIVVRARNFQDGLQSRFVVARIVYTWKWQ